MQRVPTVLRASDVVNIGNICVMLSDGCDNRPAAAAIFSVGIGLFAQIFVRRIILIDDYFYPS